MRLSVELTRGPIERTRVEVAIVTFFEDDRPLRGSAGRADWRLCGQLSRLVSEGRIQGRRGEAVLVPTRGGMQAPLLVAIGLGSRNGFDSRDWEATARDAVDRALKLGASTVALPLCEADVDDPALCQRAEALVRGAHRALADRGGELRLRVVPPGPETRRAAEALRRACPRGLADSVALDLPVAALRPGATSTHRRAFHSHSGPTS
ncbi:MAG: M17 family peptidase N-terminal domain-containing protein [Myxococcota bacterium]